jgi:hypothetical protein
MLSKDQRIIDSINKTYISPDELSHILLTKLFLFLIILLLPFTVVFASSNIVLRIPDLYGYEIKNNNVGEKFDNMISEDALANKFSKFFLHKTNSFSFIVDYNGNYGEVFTKKDISLLKNIRMKLDILFIVGILFFIFILISYFFLFSIRDWLSIRNATIVGIFFTVIFLGILNIIGISKNLSMGFLSFFANGVFHKGSILAVFFKHTLGINMALIITAISIFVEIGIFSLILYFGKLFQLRGKKF